MTVFQVPPAEAGRRLDEFLADRLVRLSRIRIRNLIREGACLVNGRPAFAGTRLQPEDHVALSLGAAPPTAMLPEPLPLEILHEDEHLIVIVKPAGMLVYPTRGVKSGTLANALSFHWNAFLLEPEAAERPVTRPGFAHRLDRPVSGIMVVAKTLRALRSLGKAFAAGAVEKHYTAILQGTVEQDQVEIDAPIGPAGSAPHWRVDPSGKPALTRLTVIERIAGATRADLEPVTGRTNQLRVHCAHIGHPIVGDTLYGGPSGPRLCLHASRLAFRHPDTNEWMVFESQSPLSYK